MDDREKLAAFNFFWEGIAKKIVTIIPLHNVYSNKPLSPAMNTIFLIATVSLRLP